MNIGVYYIETGCIDTLTISNSIIGQLAALDQAESQSRSENIKFGIRHRMRSGKTVLNHTQFLRYAKGPDAILQIAPEKAEIVRTVLTSMGRETVCGKLRSIQRAMASRRSQGNRSGEPPLTGC